MPVADLNEPELVAWGEQFGRELKTPAWVTLEGELGAGKTTLVRAIVRGRGVLEPVTSPTYSVVREYASPHGRIFHLDLYRLDNAEQLHQLGWEEIRRSKGLVLIEWPALAGDAIPAERVALSLAHLPDRSDLRRLTW